MGIVRNQHFVPQLMLRYFARSVTRRFTGLFNIDHELYVERASIASQSSDDFFYGHDQVIEGGLASLETRAGAVISDLVRAQQLPRRFSDQHWTLVLFVAVLLARTERALVALKEMIEKMNKLLADGGVPPNYLAEHSKLASPTEAISHAVHGTPLLLDLHVQLLVNGSKRGFIIGDHPVVRTNPGLDAKIRFGSNTGLGCRGLIIALPCSPSVTLLLYDGSWYAPSAGPRNGVLSATSVDIQWMNSAQVINAHENVYFDNSVDEDYMRKLLTSVDRRRSSEYTSVTEFRATPSAPASNRSLLQMGELDRDFGWDLDALKLRSHAKKFRPDGHVVYVRSKRNIDLLKPFWEAVNRGDIPVSGFPEFVRANGSGI